MNLYNEFDPNAAAWLGELIASGVLTPGRVDARSVELVEPGDLDGITQAHFFAGIGGWAYALRLAGWADDRPVWTASLPCQPFSVAGKGLGESDERHLWPVFRELVRECRPPIIFGEQVASADGRLWLAGVRADLEGMGYAVAAADLCAAGIGAPHIRQRLYWVAIRVADSDGGFLGIRDSQPGREHGLLQEGGGDVRTADQGARVEADGLADAGHKPARRPSESGEAEGGRAFCDASGRRNTDRMADMHGEGPLPSPHHGVCGREEGARPRDGKPERCGDTDRVADASGPRSAAGLSEQKQWEEGDARKPNDGGRESGGTGQRPPFDAWSDAYLIECRDGKVRRVGTGLFPLAHGLPRGVVPGGDPSVEEANASQEARKVRLKGYGNAIVPQLAAEFIRAVMG